MSAYERTHKYHNHLKLWIKQRGYKLYEVAEAVDIGLRTLNDYCAGRVPIPRRILERIAETIDCPISYLENVPVSSGSALAPDQSQTVHDPVDLTEPSQDDPPSPLVNQEEIMVLTGEEAELFLSRLGEDDMARFDPERRSALLTALQAAGTVSSGFAVVIPPLLANPEPWERLLAAADQPAALNNETLSTFESLTQACWKLSNSGQLIIAETTLSGFLPQLKQVAPHQPAVASLASRGLQLRSVLTHHRLKLADKLAICQESVALAKQSHDYSTLVASLTELSVAYRYTEQHEEALKVCQENLSYCDQASPLVQARAYGQAALIFAHCNRKREASFYLNFAQEIFPDHPEQDASFWFADSGYHTLVLYELLIHLKFGEVEAAWNTSEQYKKHSPTLLIPERWRLEILNAQGRAALLGNDLEKYAYCLEEGLSGAVALKSKKRFTEAYTIFQREMPKGWLQHHKIKPIVERYHLF